MASKKLTDTFDTDATDTPENVERTRRQMVDTLVYRAGKMATEEAGASLAMLLDRLLTFSAAHAVSADGPANAAAAFRHIADQIEDGVFSHLEGKQLAERRKKH